MLLEEQRYIAEDLERLEQGVADRIGEEPKVVRDAALTLQSGAEFAKEVISKTPASVAWVQGYSASTTDSRWSRWCF